MRECAAPLSGRPAAWAVQPNRPSTRIEGRPASPKARRTASHGCRRACGNVEIHNPDFHIPTTHYLRIGVLDFEGRFIEAKRALAAMGVGPHGVSRGWGPAKQTNKS